ncbi:MAG TPA: VWA domain-containing protein [Candidatus Elarobacter sp.]
MASAVSPMVGFLQAARRAGLRVSVAESLDALRTVETVGYDDRALLKDALGLTIAKSADEKRLFDLCFERYFNRDGVFDLPPPPADDTLDDPLLSGLARMLLSGDRAALTDALERAGIAAGVSDIRLFTQTGGFVQRILERLGGEGLGRDIERLREAGRIETAELLARLRDALRAAIRALVERNLDLSARPDANFGEARSAGRFSSLDRREIERMRVAVRVMAKRIASRYGSSRRRRRRGFLDVRATLRANMGHDGVPFITHWRRRKIEKPRVMVLCDVSGSVAAAAQFLLLFLYSMHEVVSDIHAFAFSSHLIDVSETLEREPVERAVQTIVQAIGFRSTDYGRSLRDFAKGWMDRVDRRTTVIVMGDARSNYTDPSIGVMRTLYARAKRVVWLNPESRWSWGLGDSEMLRYATYCHVVREFSRLRDLELLAKELTVAH